MNNIRPIILIIVSVGLFYFYLFPEYVVIENLRAERDKYDNVLEKMGELREARKVAALKLEEFSVTDLDKLEKMLPGRLDLTQLILDLDNIALRHRIIMKDIKTAEIGEEPVGRGEATVSAKPYKTVSVTFNAETSYANFISFLSDVEESLRVMDVISVKIKTDSENPSVQNYTASIYTYWLK